LTETLPGEAIVSTRLTRKGPLIEETYSAFRRWRLANTLQENLSRLERENPFGAKSERWLLEVTRTIYRRFRGVRIRPLVLLAQAECPLEVWKPCLLWHLGRRDLLYYLFSSDWLYPAYRSGVYALRTRDLVEFVQRTTRGRLNKTTVISEYGATRLARDLLMASALFGLIEGNVSRNFSHRHLPSTSFLYIAQAIAETVGGGRLLIDSSDWRLFLLSPEDVEREFHELHQFQKVNLESAGSVVNLRLPAPSLDEYAEMVARERSWNA
jgi:Putative inner membrane protein (DUF1819)